MGKILVSPGGVKANKEKIDKLHKNFAYTAVKSGNSWMLPSGQNATTDEYIILNGELGKVTGSNPITGGSTAIVSGTNWIKLGNAGAMGIVKSLNDQIATFTVTRNESNTTSGTFIGFKAGKICVIYINCVTGSTAGWLTIATSAEKPSYPAYGFVAATDGSSGFLSIGTSGKLELYNGASKNYIGCFVFCT